jgi:hypothetical protein
MAVLQFPKNSPMVRRSRFIGGANSATVEGSGTDNMPTILESVKVDLDEDEIRRLIDAVEHYEAYLHSQQRDESKYRELLTKLRKMLGKRG